jgi:hypothetical protein
MRWVSYGIVVSLGAVAGALWEDLRPFGTRWLQREVVRMHGNGIRTGHGQWQI